MTDQDIISIYRETGSVRAAAARLGISPQTARRRLVSNGICPGTRSRRVAQLLQEGRSVEEIALAMGVTVKTVMAHMPHSKGSYAVGEKSENALRIRASRAKAAERKEQHT